MCTNMYLHSLVGADDLNSSLLLSDSISICKMLNFSNSVHCISGVLPAVEWARRVVQRDCDLMGNCKIKPYLIIINTVLKNNIDILNQNVCETPTGNKILVGQAKWFLSY